MNKIRYLKPSGKEMEVNDTEAVRELAVINGWKEVKPKKPKKVKVDSPTQLDKLI